jgi:hypothetical protein
MITSNTDRTVTLKLNGNRSDLNKLKSSDITVLVDLTRIYEAGEKSLSYDISFPGNVQNNAIEVVSRKPDNVKLTVAEWATKEIPVEIETTGTPAEGYIIDEANVSASPKSVDISGPKELIDQIAMGKITANMDGAKESFEQRQKLTLCDSQGKPIDTDLSDVLVGDHMILVKVPVLMEKEIRLNLPIIYDGIRTQDDVKVKMSFETITVTGSPAVVSKMKDVIDLEPLNLNEIDESTTLIRTYTLPNDVISSEKDNTVIVNLTVSKVDRKTITIANDQIEIKGIPDGYEAASYKTLSITLRGEVDALKGFSNNSIRVTVDLNGATDSGNYPVTIELLAAQKVCVLGEYQVFIILNETN